MKSEYGESLLPARSQTDYESRLLRLERSLNPLKSTLRTLSDRNGCCTTLLASMGCDIQLLYASIHSIQTHIQTLSNNIHHVPIPCPAASAATAPVTCAYCLGQPGIASALKSLAVNQEQISRNQITMEERFSQNQSAMATMFGEAVKAATQRQRAEERLEQRIEQRLEQRLRAVEMALSSQPGGTSEDANALLAVGEEPGLAEWASQFFLSPPVKH
jgi:hypothetical protein